MYLFFWFKAKPFCLFSAGQSLPSSAGLAGLADGVGNRGERDRTERGQTHPTAWQDGFQVLLFLHVNRCTQMKMMRNQTYCNPQGAPREHWAKISLSEDRSVPKETSCCGGLVLLCSPKENRPGKVSCEEAKHPVLLYTPLLSFLAKQDLIIITRRTEKETLVVYDSMFC